MINIQLTSTPLFNFNTASKLPQTGWQFTPASPLEVISFIGQASPSQKTIDVLIKDYILALGNSVYDTFKVGVILRHPNINGQTVQWLTLSGFTAVEDPQPYTLSQNNLEVQSFLDFNTTNIPAGVTTTTIEFYVFGFKPGGLYDVLDVVQFKVNLNRLNAGQLYLEPATPINFSYIIGGSIPASRTVKLYSSGIFTIVVGKHISLGGDNLVLDSDIDGIKTYSGSGTQDIIFTLESSIDFEENIDPYYATTALFTSVSGEVLELLIRVHVYESGENLVLPETLNFRAIKGVQEAHPKPIAIRGVGAWTVTKPYFLGLNVVTGVDSDNVDIVPVPSDNLTPGNYTGDIKVMFDGVEYIVAVNHTVVDGLYSGFSPSKINFTKDRDAISEIYGLDSEKVTFLTEIESGEYNSLQTKTHIANFSKGIFNGKSDFWLGRIIHKAMPSLSSLDDIGLQSLSFETSPAATVMPFRVYNYYNPSLTHFLMKYITRATNIQAGESREFFNVAYLKGRKPERFVNDAGIVDFKKSPIRVTKNSFTLLPIYKKGNTSRLKVFKNGVLYATLYPNSPTHVFFGVQLFFKPFTQGDVIDVKVEPIGIAVTSIQMVQRYIVFPEGKQSYHIAWENEHGVPEVLEFTGDYEFKSDHKGITNLSFDNYLEFTEKMGTKRKLNFSANTGWLLKSNQERIDSLVDADRAWIVFTDIRLPIALVPDDAKITNIDSDAGTYQYKVDFTINPRHELENNSF